MDFNLNYNLFYQNKKVLLIAKLIISYDGSKYFGSQIQMKKDTIHGRIKTALNTLGIFSKIAFSGRTDKNVHASMQVVSFELPIYWKDMNKLKEKLVSFVPPSIVIKSIQKLDSNFHARFSAKKRSYRYIISKKPLNAFNNSYMSYYGHIDISLIKKAAIEFIGIHDFEYFHKHGSDPISTIREIYNIQFYSYKEMYILKFTANSYLRSQIRMIVYALLEVSAKRLSIEDLQKQIKKEKRFTNKLASPYGLYLSKVYY
jgi:tRNA pseudouridine38-40 synthase